MNKDDFLFCENREVDSVNAHFDKRPSEMSYKHELLMYKIVCRYYYFFNSIIAADFLLTESLPEIFIASPVRISFPSE